MVKEIQLRIKLKEESLKDILKTKSARVLKIDAKLLYATTNKTIGIIIAYENEEPNRSLGYPMFFRNVECANQPEFISKNIVEIISKPGSI